jgi:hypothetical protein
MMVTVPRCTQCSAQHSKDEICLECKRSNARIADREKTLAKQVNVPDPRPARVLRASLSTSRRLGVPFEQAWSDALAAAVTEAEDWELVFAWSKHEWESAYHRESNGVKGDFALLEPLTAA